MSLDLFSTNVDDAVNYAARVSAPELPSTFSDNFNDAWNRGYLTQQSISGEIRKTTARQQFVDDAIAKTGDASFAQSGEGGGFDTAGFNAKIAKHKAERPDLAIDPISDEAVQARADEIGTRQLSDSRNFANRERTFGGSVGQLLGSAGAAFSDPVNLIAFPLAAPESFGVLGTALAWGGIGAGSQVAIEALNATSMERIQPGYGASDEPVTHILENAVGGAVLGGGIKGLANLWTRAKTGSWPRTVRDAGNVVESEAQIAGTNPMPGVGGEAAHRTALQKAIDDLAGGRPVDVDGIAPDDMLRAYEARLVPTIDAMSEVHAARNAVTMERAAQDAATQPELPFAGSIAEGQEVAAVSKLGQRLEDIAESVGTRLAPEEGRKLAEKISRLPNDDALAALDEFFLRPNTLLETLPTPLKPPSNRVAEINTPTTEALRAEMTPAKIEEARTHPDMEETVARDLDKLMLERPDLEVPTGVTVDPEGRTVPTTRKVEDVVAEADALSAAAKEIELCVGPYPEEAA